MLNLQLGNLGDILGGVGTLAKDIREAITGEMPAEKKVILNMKLAELEQQSNNAQTAINLADAQSDSLFRGGWRPAVGWTCALGIAYQFLFYPLFGKLLPLIPLDASVLMSLLMGMLGLGGFRTVEKIKGLK